MSKVKEKKEKEEPKKDGSYSIHQFGLQNDLINPIATLDFPGSDDRGLEFRTSNISLTFRLNKHDYYNLIEMLFSEVYDEFQESDNYNPLIDDFQDFLLAKMNGDI